jgi:hypothetical protein
VPATLCYLIMWCDELAPSSRSPVGSHLSRPAPSPSNFGLGVVCYADNKVIAAAAGKGYE